MKKDIALTYKDGVFRKSNEFIFNDKNFKTISALLNPSNTNRRMFASKNPRM